MKIDRIDPPRRFGVGGDNAITMSDCARIGLAPDEQVTFTTESGAEYDVARKSWGFYATPSLNGRLPAHGLRPALCVNSSGQRYLLLVERGCEQAFQAYLDAEGLAVRAWLDEDDPTDRPGYDSAPSSVSR